MLEENNADVFLVYSILQTYPTFGKILHGPRWGRLTYKQGSSAMKYCSMKHLTLLLHAQLWWRSQPSNRQLFEAGNIAGSPALGTTQSNSFYPIWSGIIQRLLSYTWGPFAHDLALLRNSLRTPRFLSVLPPPKQKRQTRCLPY